MTDESDCIRIFGLVEREARAMMKIRAWGANRLLDLKWCKGWSGLPPRRSDRFAINSNRIAQSCGSDEVDPALGDVLEMRVKRLSRFPDRPHSAGYFIGDSDGGLVVANTALQLQTP